MTFVRMLVLLAMVAGIPAVTASTSGAAAPSCLGRTATIVAQPGVETVGTSGPDVIVGTSGADVIRGRGGDDRICSKGGADNVKGGGGDDRIKLGKGSDTGSGGSGEDRIWGQSGSDDIRGNGGKDTLDGGSGADSIVGGKKGDVIKGKSGRDDLRGNSGHDTIFGGKGIDACAGGTGTDVLSSCNEASEKLVLAQWEAPSHLNAYLTTAETDLLASSLVLESLAEMAPDGSIVSALATEIPTRSNGGISEDRTEITWTLRSGVVWSDGSALTAADVVFTWEYCTNQLTGCTTDAFSNVVDVAALNDATVRVTFDGPAAYPFDPFVGYRSPIIQRAQFLGCIGSAAQGCIAQNSMPVGTGPYVVTEFEADERVSYELNGRYRSVSEGAPFFTTIELEVESEAEAAARTVLENGEADFAPNLRQLAPELVASMVASGKGDAVASFTTNVEHLSLNQTDPDSVPPSDYNGGANPNPHFFENDILHDALSMAIDRAEIGGSYGVAARPTCNIWNVGVETSTNNDVCLVQDIEGANALLDANGYLDTDSDGIREMPGGPPLEFDFVTSTSDMRQTSQDFIQGYWAQIGVLVHMTNQPPTEFFTPDDEVSIWRFLPDIQMFTNGTDRPDALDYLFNWTTAEIPDPSMDVFSGNIVRLASPAFDALYSQLEAMSFADPARPALVMALNDTIVDYSIIPLVNRNVGVSALADSVDIQGDLNGWDSELWNIEDWTRRG